MIILAFDAMVSVAATMKHDKKKIEEGFFSYTQLYPVSIS